MSLKVFHFGVQLHFQFLRRKLFPLTFVLCAQYCLPSDTALTVLKDLAKHNCGWRQTNMSVTLWVCGFSMVVGIARKDLRNVCEFLSFILGETFISFTLQYEVFQIDLSENKDLIFRRSAWTLPIKK